MLEQLDNSNISKHLGKSSAYIKQYDPSLLVREPRQSNRKHLNIDDAAPPFIGCDIWNGYEVSGLLDNGLPVAGVAKVMYSASNRYIVESKSMKLYWNSFNMTCLGGTEEVARAEMARRAAADLSDLLETEVKVGIVPAKAYSDAGHTLDQYDTLEEYYSPKCDTYVETPELLKVDEHTYNIHADSHGVVRFRSALLKSNCRVTSAPDFGDAYIYFKSSNDDLKVDPASLLQYIVSFRDECHFHEEICETLYTRLNDVYKPSELMVACLYTRRGGWDIVPVRASSPYLLPIDIINPYTEFHKTSRQ